MSRPKVLRSPGSSAPIDLTDPGTPIEFLDHQFRQFEARVIPMAVEEIQREEMRRAFYAGARAVLHTVDDAFAEGLPPEEVGKVLPAIAVEVDRYTDKLAALAARDKGTH